MATIKEIDKYCSLCMDINCTDVNITMYILETLKRIGMTTIKSYTTLEQSKKLAKILPLESADMYWDFDVQKHEDYPMIMDDQFDDTCVRAWSLAALLGVLPEGTRLLKSTNISSIGDTKYHCDCPKGNVDEWFDNPIDACVAMIEKLHELNLL